MQPRRAEAAIRGGFGQNAGRLRGTCLARRMGVPWAGRTDSPLQRAGGNITGTCGEIQAFCLLRRLRRDQAPCLSRRVATRPPCQTERPVSKGPSAFGREGAGGAEPLLPLCLRGCGRGGAPPAIVPARVREGRSPSCHCACEGAGGAEPLLHLCLRGCGGGGRAPLAIVPARVREGRSPSCLCPSAGAGGPAPFRPLTGPAAPGPVRSP